MWARHWLAIGLAGVALAVLYLAFAASPGWREYIAALVVGALATLASVIFVTSSGIRFCLRWQDIAQGWRLPADLVTDTVKIVGALAKEVLWPKRAANGMVAVPFEPDPNDSPVQAGRRALAILYASATPNVVIVGWIREQRVLLYHQITPDPVPTLLQKLGARP